MSRPRGGYILRLEAAPAGPDRHGRDADYRLRAALKVLARAFGLRCTSIARDERPGEPRPLTRRIEQDTLPQ